MGSAKPHPWSPFADTRALEPEFIAAYLEPWSAFAPLEELHQTFLETRPFGFVTLIAQHGRLERQQRTGDSRLKRSLVAWLVRQLAQGAR